MLDSGHIPQTVSARSGDVAKVCGPATLLIEAYDLPFFTVVEDLMVLFDGGKYVAYLTVKSLSFTPRVPGV